jgi:hypothetical protein
MLINPCYLRNALGSACSCLLFSLPAAAQDFDLLPRQCQRSYYQLKGPVLRVTEKQWLPPVDSIWYSSAGAFTPDGSYRIERSSIMTFDSTGNLVSVAREEPDERKRKELQAISQQYYYRKGQLVAYTLKDEAKTDSVQYSYRKNGLMDHYSVYDGKGNLQHKMTYVYKNGKLVTLRKQDKGNVPVAMTKFKYNESQLTETQHFDEQYRLSENRRYSRKAAADGQWNESYSITGNDGKMKGGMSWVKDKDGNILEQSTINANREVSEYHSYSYDSNGQPVEEKIFSSQQEANIENRYTYDGQGNWTRKEIFYSGRLRAVVIRELQYH